MKLSDDAKAIVASNLTLSAIIIRATEKPQVREKAQRDLLLGEVIPIFKDCFSQLEKEE
jgi:hypothetical protein